MDAKKSKRLQAQGWRVGTAAEFLSLSPEESALVETKLALGMALKAQRLRKHLTQEALALQLRSSQSRIAKMESGDPSVSLDLLFKSLFHLGVTQQRIARVLMQA
jgi:DNA-binding XRE family transcriptional regulator